MNKASLWLNLHRDSLWRFHLWTLNWLKLADALAGILTFGFCHPCWWTQAFDFYLDRGWL